MGASRSYRNNRSRTRKLENTGERRAGKLEADSAYMEHRGNAPVSMEAARRRKLIVEQGIDPDTGQLYSSIRAHREALEEYWLHITTPEMAHIKGSIWRKIDPSSKRDLTAMVVTHPSYVKRLAGAQ